MKVIERLNVSDLLFIDIETVRVTDKMDENDTIKDAWLYKARYQNEVSRKTGESLTPEEYFEDKAALYAPFAKIVCISVGRIRKDGIETKSFYGDDESMLLELFCDTLSEITARAKNTKLVGFNIIGFDIPFIVKRCIINRIKLPDILDQLDAKPWEVTFVDLSTIWKWSAFYPDSLVAVCAAAGIPSPKNGLDGSMVGEAYYDGRLDEIMEYCEDDVVAVANMYLLFMRQPFLEKISNN